MMLLPIDLKNLVPFAALCAASPLLCTSGIALGSLSGCGDDSFETHDPEINSFPKGTVCDDPEIRGAYSPGRVLNVPIVFHSVESSSQSVFDSDYPRLSRMLFWNDAYRRIDLLNAAFASSKIRFFLRDADNVIDEALSKQEEAYEIEQFNDYLCNNAMDIFMFNENAKPSFKSQAFAGGILASSQATTEAWVSAFGSSFGLLPTSYGGNEQVERQGCEMNGDRLCDTPADPGNNSHGCSVNPETCEIYSCPVDGGKKRYQPDIGNFMSDYPNACLDHFSAEQQDLMRCVLQNYFKSAVWPEPDSASSEYLTVNCNSPADTPSIADAVSKIAAGGTIEVCGGQYYESLNFMGESARVTVSARKGENVRILGKRGLHEKGPVISVAGGANVLLSGLTITRGKASYGGCISVQNSSLTTDEVTLHSCEAEEIGGAIFAVSSDIHLSNTNVIESSSGITGGALAAFQSRVNIEGGTIRDNGPIAIYMEDCPASVLRGVSLLFNEGAVSIFGGGSIVEECIVEDNAAIKGAGLMAQNADIRIMTSEFHNNESSVSGGAIDVDSGLLRIADTAIVGNIAPRGAAVFFSGSELNISGGNIGSNVILLPFEGLSRKSCAVHAGKGVVRIAESTNEESEDNIPCDLYRSDDACYHFNDSEIGFVCADESSVCEPENP